MANDSLSSAALAFDANANGGSSTAVSSDSGMGETVGVESLFGEVGVLDSDSPEAGGDGIQEEEPNQRKPAKTAAADDDDKDEDVLVDDEDHDLAVDDEDGEDDEADEKDDDKDDEDVYEVVILFI